VDVSATVFQAGRSSEVNIKDTFRYNIAGYRVAQLIGLATVPMSVARAVDGKDAAVTWWVDDVQMDEKARLAKKTFGPNPDRTSKQIQIMRVFDELIQNRDRNQGNILWTKDWTMWLIDHTRAFRLGKELLKPENLTRCDRGLLDRLRAITAESLAAAVGESLTRLEQEALLARRDQIVKHYEDRIAKLGEAVVLFEFSASSSQTARSTPAP
jgi:biotin-(acetyl-CoA carboxylase) ligase